MLELKIIADLSEKGYNVSIPFGHDSELMLS